MRTRPKAQCDQQRNGTCVCVCICLCVCTAVLANAQLFS